MWHALPTITAALGDRRLWSHCSRIEKKTPSALCCARAVRCPTEGKKKKNKKLCVIKITRKETKQFFLYLPSSLLAYLHLETRPKDDTFAVRRRELLGNITIAQVPYVNTVEYEINDWVRRCFQTIHKRVQTCHEKKRKCTTMNK